MNKQNYLIFKDDFKKSMEYVKLSNKHRKVYYNDGFKTQEAQNKAIEENSLKMQEIRKSMTHQKYGYAAELFEFHLAYYIAKHQLDETAQKEYIKQAVEKTNNYKNTDDNWLKGWIMRNATGAVENYLNAYGEE